MNKPITLVADDLKKDIVEMINSSKMPMFIVESILKDIMQEVHFLAAKQLEIDRSAYEKEQMQMIETEVLQNVSYDREGI